MKSRFIKILFFSFAVCLFTFPQAFAQTNLPFLRVSPKAKVVQYIEFASVEIDYSRPGVKDREIWGGLVPYGLAPNNFGNGNPMPWRAGANENTAITFSHDVKINGNSVAAGSYGLHMLVHEEEWTVILNKEFQAWGSFFYETKDDVLRFKVKPTETHFVEWLQYGFEDLTNSSVVAYLHWGKVKVPFKVEIDRHEVVLSTYKDLLTNLAGFNQGAWAAAATYCLNNNTNLDEALTWIDKALSMNGGNNFNNTTIKASLLAATGKEAEGNKLVEASIDAANENEINAYGYLLMNQGKLDDALRIFKLNVQRFPDSWNPYDSLGEALNNKGDKAGAKKNYEIAYEKAPANQKARIEGIIKGL